MVDGQGVLMSMTDDPSPMFIQMAPIDLAGLTQKGKWRRTGMN